jgi:predicted GIY-YIG superfamily endonuclease
VIEAIDVIGANGAEAIDIIGAEAIEAIGAMEQLELKLKQWSKQWKQLQQLKHN